MAYAPRDEKAFAQYVAATISHYRNRVEWFQVFNEPVFTTYALPRKFGYSAKDYAHWTKVFTRAAKEVAPNCRVLAGIGYISEGQILEDWQEFFEAGGAEGVDAFDIHHYPRLRPPEFIEKPLEKLVAWIAQYAPRKPIWLTEYGYYADDDPWCWPPAHSDFNPPLPSEQLQADYALRWATMMFACGVEKIFYHAGTCGAINRENLEGIFFEYGGTPRKIYTVQAVMSELFDPSARFVQKVELAPTVRLYVFQSGELSFGVLWAPKGGAPQVRLLEPRLEYWDAVGRPLVARSIVPGSSPVFILGRGVAPETLAAAIAAD